MTNSVDNYLTYEKINIQHDSPILFPSVPGRVRCDTTFGTVEGRDAPHLSSPQLDTAEVEPSLSLDTRL